MPVGNSPKHENPKNSEATLNIYDILDKGEKGSRGERGKVLDFRIENGQFTGRGRVEQTGQTSPC